MGEGLLEPDNRDRSIAFLLFGFLLACYGLTYTGVIQSSDGLAMFATTESIVRRGEVDMNQLLWMDLQQGSYGPDGQLYSRKGLGMTLLTLPLVWFAKVWSSRGLVQTALLLNPLLTAWTGALLYRTGRRLTWTRSVSIMVCLVFGLGTLAWPYSQTFFSDPMSAWGLFGALYCLLGYRQTGSKRYLLLAGLSWGLAYLSRTINLISLPIYLVVLVLVIQRSVGRTLRIAPLYTFYRLIVRNWRAFANFLIPIIMAGFLSLWWNWLRYGSIWESGYLDAESFSADWLAGVSGLLISPGRGLFLYCPILLLALPGTFWFRRNRPWILVHILALTAVYVAVYGKWYMWHGGFSWGSRFMVVLMPFLALLTGPVFVWISEQRMDFALDSEQISEVNDEANPNKFREEETSWSPIGLGAFTLCSVLFTLSVGIQWLGMVAPFGLVQSWLEQTVQPLFAPETFTQWRYSPLLLQWRFLTQAQVPFSWWQAAGGLPDQSSTADIGTTFIFSRVNLFNLILLLVAIVAGLLLLLRVHRNARDGVGAERRVISEGHRDRNWSVVNWLYGAVVSLLVLLILTPLDRARGAPELTIVTEQIEAIEQAGDAILALTPQESQQFANGYHGNLPVYGLFQRGELDAVDEQWIMRLIEEHRRIWVVPDQLSPDASGWERFLRVEHFLLWEERVSDSAGRRLALYQSANQAIELDNNGLGAIFGNLGDDPTQLSTEDGYIRLNRCELSTELVSGGSLLVVLHWESLRPVENNFQVFIHFIDESGKRVAQRDGQPVQWMRPTSTWQSGDTIVDRYGLLLPLDLPEGNYTVLTGLYDPMNGDRLPVNADTGEFAVELGTVTVKQP
ncbi:hypothetical protein KFU94_37515 [Chloroflexi bacterium TSY]|nr:hypothetical protein [Chloroflexi bacterium TSY]